MKNKLLPFLLLCFALVVSIEYQLALPYSYYLLSLTLSVLIVVMVFRSIGEQTGSRQFISVLIAILVLYVLLRSIYLIASNFSLIPLDDGYRDYNVAKIFLQNGRSDVISDVYQSGWPLLHVLAISISQVLGVDLFYVVLVLPLVLSVAIFLFLFLFIREIGSMLGMSSRVVLLAILVFAVSSDNIYSSMQFVRQNFAIFFLTAIFYFIYKYEKTRSSRIKLLFLFFLLVLVTVHDFTAFTVLLFLSLFFVLTRIGNWSKLRLKWKFSVSPMRSITPSIVILFSVVMVAWWTFHSPMVLETYLPFLRNIRLELYTDTLTLASARWGFYEVLRPHLQVLLLEYLYPLSYAPAAIGFLLYLRKTIQSRELTAGAQFLLYSMMAFGGILAIYEFVLGLQPLRMLWFSAPLLALFAAILYGHLLSNRHALPKLAASCFLSIIIFSTFIAPFSRGFVPLYLYDPSVKFEDVGTHNPHYLNVLPFVRAYVHIENSKTILSDDPSLLYTLLPAGTYSSFENLYYDPEAINGTGVSLFEFLHLDPAWAALPYIRETDLLENTTYLKDQVVQKLNIVYDDGYSRIYVSR